MKKHIKDIILSILGIGVEGIKIIGVAVGATICTVFEFVASCTIPGMMLGLFGRKLDSPVLYSYIPEFFYNILDYVDAIKESRDEIRTIKRQQREYEEAISLKNEMSNKTYSDEVLNQIRDILIKTDSLSLPAQKEIVVELKKVLTDYSSQQMSTIEQTTNTSDKSQVALERLKAIDENGTYLTEKQELLSVMNAIESNTETPKMKRLKL